MPPPQVTDPVLPQLRPGQMPYPATAPPRKSSFKGKGWSSFPTAWDCESAGNWGGVHSMQCMVLSRHGVVRGAQCPMPRVRGAAFSAWCLVYTAQCPVWGAQCIASSVPDVVPRCVLHRVQRAAQSVRGVVPGVVPGAWCIRCGVQRRVCTARCLVWYPAWCPAHGAQGAAYGAGCSVRRRARMARCPVWCPVRGAQRARRSAGCVVCSTLTSRCLWP